MTSHEYKDDPGTEQLAPPIPNHCFRNIWWPSLLSFVVAALTAWGAGAAVTLDAAQKSAICATRTSCSIDKIYDAGKSPTGAAIAVAEVHL